ncbi:glycosyltransferase family 4 protein [Prochlorococcus marinus XMU1410]|uniref:glycosyltransferase family 4 protein n=1 Tax=Prochlorococcus marinus TaxID=1219 RepID=UPI001ADCFC5B|nr:glycosyltransferase family 4 protein [Prochlorococcus marinus]MBO8242378.1 glycosyltransferase family 4 protein [Prochlorococcus marinus XMU1410]MBW3053526.1 hypothetical protein [Prochlorococcus marinus str. MU1410]
MKKKFCVIQIGARYNYKIPLFFAENNSLACFYTDIHSSHLIFGILNFIPEILMTKSLIRLKKNRKLPFKLLKELVSDSFLNLFLKDSKIMERNLFKRVLDDNFRDCDAIYTNIITSDIDLISKAKKKGIYIIHEVFLNPFFSKIYADELLEFPEFNTKKDLNKEDNKTKFDIDLIKYNLADKIIVPSKYIYNAVVEKGVSKDKIKVIEPSSYDEDFLNVKTNPKRGRIIFVGRITLMKGIHYFAKVCREFLKEKKDYEFIAVGKNYLDLNNPLLLGPKYLGYLEKKDLKEIYRTADVFVLPSISDAFPAVHLEAMSFGIPVILTNACGSVVRDGNDGFIVPAKDYKIMKYKIEEIVENRNLRAKMSKSARLRVKNYDFKNYSKKLKEIIDF